MADEGMSRRDLLNLLGFAALGADVLCSPLAKSVGEWYLNNTKYRHSHSLHMLIDDSRGDFYFYVHSMSKTDFDLTIWENQNKIVENESLKLEPGEMITSFSIKLPRKAGEFEYKTLVQSPNKSIEKVTHATLLDNNELLHAIKHDTLKRGKHWLNQFDQDKAEYPELYEQREFPYLYDIKVDNVSYFVRGLEALCYGDIELMNEKWNSQS